MAFVSIWRLLEFRASRFEWSRNRDGQHGCNNYYCHSVCFRGFRSIRQVASSPLTSPVRFRRVWVPSAVGRWSTIWPTGGWRPRSWTTCRSWGGWPRPALAPGRCGRLRSRDCWHVDSSAWRLRRELTSRRRGRCCANLRRAKTESLYIDAELRHLKFTC